jgi:hypothetical protein
LGIRIPGSMTRQFLYQQDFKLLLTKSIES